MTAAIFAFRSRSQPAIVQVNEVATATMTAAKGAIYPVYSMMRDMGEPFSLNDYLPAVSGYYTDASGNLLSFPFNSSTPILYYNKTMFRDAGLDPETPPKTWPELGLLQSACATAAPSVASPRRGRPGSTSRTFRRFTICRWPRAQMALPASMRH